MLITQMLMTPKRDSINTVEALVEAIASGDYVGILQNATSLANYRMHTSASLKPLRTLLQARPKAFLFNTGSEESIIRDIRRLPGIYICGSAMEASAILAADC